LRSSAVRLLLSACRRQLVHDTLADQRPFRILTIGQVLDLVVDHQRCLI
jgi:hypothetical protein